MKNVIRKKTVSIVCVVPAVQTGARYKFNFAEDEDLRNVQLWGVQTFYKGDAEDDAGTINPNGILIKDPDWNVDLIDKIHFMQTFLNLYDVGSDNFLKDAPFVIFQTVQGNWTQSGVPDVDNPVSDIVERDPKYFTGQKLDLQNSFINIVNNSNVKAGETFSIVIDFYYSRIDLDSVKQIN